MAVKRCTVCGYSLPAHHVYGDPVTVEGCAICELEAEEGAWAVGPDGGDAERVEADVADD